jgi:predicted small lipoprotein YifL
MPDAMTFCRGLALAAATLLLASCGGGGPFGNPPKVDNAPPDTVGGQLSFIYYQQCIEPILQAQLDVNIGGVISRNSCAGSGCHDDVAGTGGALRIVANAATVPLDGVADDPDQVRSTAIYRNFYSAQGETIAGNPGGSRLVNKPLVRNVLHGGGLIFTSVDDSNVKRISYWINNPGLAGQDEFSASLAAGMFTPAFDPVTNPDPAPGTSNE